MRSNPSTLARAMKAAADGLRGLWPRWGGNHAGGWGGRNTRIFLPGSSLDLDREAGELWLNSLVALGVAWLGDRFPKPAIRVSRINKATGDYEPLPRHPLVDLWGHPNDCYFRHSLETAVGLSLVCDGNGYVHKLRDKAGRMAQLWWLPHTAVEPCWPEDGSAFLSHYKVTVDAAEYRVPVADLVHVRKGLDPENPRKGLAPLRAALREVATDNRVATYTLGLLRNSAVPGLAVIPDAPDLEPTKEHAQQIKDAMRDGFARDNTGSTVVLAGKYVVQPLGFSPNDLTLDKLPAQSIARIASAVGVAAMSLGLPDPNKTYANLAEANRASWGTITAIQDRIAEALRWGLLPEFGTDPLSHVVEYDYDSIAELNEAADQQHARVREDWKAGVVMLNEARELLGMDPDPDGDRFYPGTGGDPPPAMPEPGALPAPGEPANGDIPPALAARNGNGKALWWQH